MNICWPARPDRPDPGGAGVRFSQRPARHREFDRHAGVDPDAAAALRGDLGGVLQFHRLSGLRRSRGAHRRRRHHLRRRDGCARHLRRADRRHLLEPHHLVGRHSVDQFARADRRFGRCRRHQGRPWLDRMAGACSPPAPSSCCLRCLDFFWPCAGAGGVVGVRARQPALGRRPRFNGCNSPPPR